jgi:hypothetical protein
MALARDKVSEKNATAGWRPGKSGEVQLLKSSAAAVPDVATKPVRYTTGEVVQTAGDLAGGGFGVPWGHTRNFASGLGFNQDFSQGYNWFVAQWPQLLIGYSAAVIGLAQRPLWFAGTVDGQKLRRAQLEQRIKQRLSGADDLRVAAVCR